MFIDKLNKKQEGVYVLEEEKTIVDGKWEGYLNHDNVEPNSIYIYTEEKLSGDKVENYFVSTSAETPWKLYLKVFSNSPKIYITYESKGDQVEAEDVNVIQNAVNTQNIKVANLVAETLRLENTKANLTYVDTELLKKYDKDKVYTKEEVEQLIDDLIGGSPTALDTLKEIADALNNDPDFASTMTTELSKKVDKVAGKSLSDENYTIAEKGKLAEVEDKANNYIHPLTHSANMIEENINKRFVSDIEKNTWNKVNKKADTVYVDKTFATKSEIGGTGVGDMLKSIYDKNNNGKIDLSENAEKLGNKLPDEYMKSGPLTYNDLKGV